MPLVFSYGTLQQEDVQLAAFGRRLKGQADELPGFEPSRARIEDAQAVAATGRTHHANVTFNGRHESRVSGTVFEIDDAELAAADRYEQLAQYKRIAVVLASGKQAWVYVSARSAPEVSDKWERGSPYEQYVGRWSRGIAPLFLSWLALPAGRRWLDVGCGTGALCAAIVDQCSPFAVVGIDPSQGFLATAASNLAGRVAFDQGSAAAIPFGDAEFDVVVSGLVLNFAPDQDAALREMARVTRKGGTIAAYVWDYAGQMELMRHFWDAAVALDPNAASLDEGVRFPICRADALEKLFVDAGLEGVEVKSIDIATEFADFDDYWRPFLGGQGPAPGYAMALDETARASLRDRIRESLPIKADGSISLVARAWATRATMPW